VLVPLVLAIIALALHPGLVLEDGEQAVQQALSTVTTVASR
jgi:hypothetical protein